MKQAMINWFLSEGVTMDQLATPSLPIVERRPCGKNWLYFYEDDALWQPRSGELSSSTCWCLGMEHVDHPGTYAIDGALHIHANPLDWLRSNRAGIVIIDWDQAFDNLYRVPRISIPTALKPQYDKAMRMPKLPKLEVR